MRRLLLIALVGAVAFPAAAATPEDDGKRERRICKREITLGSNVRQKRTCLTKKEWEQTEAYNRQTTKEWANAIDGKVRGN
jgi:hypothetical protein